MRNNRLRALFPGALVCAGAVASAIQVEVATTKPSYYPGEVLPILISVTNHALLDFGSTLQSLYRMDGTYTPDLFGAPVLTHVTTPHTWTMTLGWTHYNPAIGNHTVAGIVVAHGTSAPVAFSILAPPVPQGNFLIDFDVIPETTAAIADPMAYDLCGVHFHTAMGARCTLQNIEGDSWLQGFDPYPTGANIVVGFDRPVFGARVQVAGGTGVTITMLAKDAQGQTLASASSPAITQPGAFAQTLSLTTDRPIASLEWWPSIPNSMLGIDNLFVEVVPSLSFAVLGSTLRLSWPTVAGTGYQLWESSDLQTWSPYGPLQSGTGNVLSQDWLMTSGTRRFFRLSQSN